MKKWIVMLAMLSALTACAQTPEPESAELTELSAATSESADAEETPAPISTAEPTATPEHRHTRADTFGNPCRYPRADSCPYAGTHGSADGRTCPGAGQYELWCCAL